MSIQNISNRYILFYEEFTLFTVIKIKCVWCAVKKNWELKKTRVLFKI